MTNWTGSASCRAKSWVTRSKQWISTGKTWSYIGICGKVVACGSKEAETPISIWVLECRARANRFMKTVGTSWASFTSDLVRQVLVTTLNTRSHVRSILSICVLNIVSACIASWAFVAALWSGCTPSSSRTYHWSVRADNCIVTSWRDLANGCAFYIIIHTALVCTVYLLWIIHIFCRTSPTNWTD